MSIDRRGALRSLLLLAALTSAPAFAQRLYDDMIVAVANDRAGEVKALLARGVDPDIVDPNGDPLLYTAARAGFGATVDVLLAAKVNVDARNRFGDTPLMAAALEGRLDIAKKLRARGAAIDYKGWTPLSYAATGGHDNVVVWLLDQGANVNAESANGTTPLMMAVREGRGSTVELLVKRGADVNHRNENGVSALDWAKRGNERAMEELLRRAGAR
ncbi:MAG TPA: ankyrin repeat domain-containing protein [Casimicrobiaceae bacterium]|nr:ankyrin repeat domain-containing protein [Casimicrobiaceae bacterium]